MKDLYVVLLSFVSSYTSSLPLPFYFIDLTSRQYLSTTPLYTGLPIITLVIQAVWGGRITTTNLWFILILWRRVLISSLSREDKTKYLKENSESFFNHHQASALVNLHWTLQIQLDLWFQLFIHFDYILSLNIHRPLPLPLFLRCVCV